MLRSAAAFILAALIAAASAPAAQAQTRDVPGARDYPGIGRFGGSVITGYQVKDFDAMLLQAAPFKDGKAADGSQLSINLVFPKGYPEWQQGSEMFQAAMAELGVEVVVEQLELATWIQRMVTTDEVNIPRPSSSGCSLQVVSLALSLSLLWW